MNMGAVLTGDYGARISAAVLNVAKKVEDNLGLLTAAVTPNDQGKQAAVPGALTLKQVRKASGKLLAAKLVAAPPNPI